MAQDPEKVKKIFLHNGRRADGWYACPFGRKDCGEYDTAHDACLGDDYRDCAEYIEAAPRMLPAQTPGPAAPMQEGQQP